MQFEYEYQMFKPAEAWLKSKGLMVKREFPTPWGICDLVGCSFNKRSVNKRLRLGQKKPIGSHFRTMLLSHIPNENEAQPIEPARLIGMFSEFFDEERIISELNRLDKDKFIQRTQFGSLYKLNGWMPLHKKLVALELKLSRIQDVLQQAISNLEFANESYVGLPMENARRLLRSSIVSSFAKNSIGIIGLNAEGHQVFRSARRNAYGIDPILQTHCAERFWRQYAKGNLA
jgi:hypothetical protein